MAGKPNQAGGWFLLALSGVSGAVGLVFLAGGRVGIATASMGLAVLAGIGALASWICVSHRRAIQATLAHNAGFRETTEALVLAVDARNPSGCGHSHRSRLYALELARLVAAHHQGFFQKEGPPPDWLEFVGTAALLHDVGKIAIPGRLLSRPGHLSRAEREKLRRHAILGEEILAQAPFLFPLGRVVRSHHECWDGTGYPDGLAGPAIPLEARLVALANKLEWQSREPAKPNLNPVENLIEYVGRRAGAEFDPKLVELYCSAAFEIEERVQAQLQEKLSAGSSDPKSSGLLASLTEAPREAGILFELTSRLSTTLDLEATLEALPRMVLEISPAHSVVVLVPDHASDQLIPRRAEGPLADQLMRRTIGRNEGTIGWAWENGQALYNIDPRIDLGRQTSLENPPTRSAAVLPLIDRSQTLGVIALFAQEPETFSDDNSRVLETLAPQFALALRNGLLFAETQASSLTDPLTALPNNRFLQSQIDKELARATRKGHPLTLVVLDLDEFKPINDQHGHLAGDSVLRAVARELKEGFRHGDFVCRYAGDEFVVLLPETTPEEARTIVHRIQEHFREIRFEIPSGARVEVGVSAGTACFPLDGGSREELLRRADKEMYRDKASRKALQA